MRENLGRQAEVGVVADAVGVGAHLVQHHGVVGRVHDHGHVAVVLGRRANHGRAADVDVLDGVRQRAVVLGHGLLERVQVHHQQVDGGDLVLGQRGHVLGQVAAGQDATVHLRVQRLHAAVQHFRKAGVVGHLRHGQAGVGQQLGGAAGGKQHHAERVQVAREIDDAGLVGNGEKGLLDHGLGERFKVNRVAAASCAACCD
ncbi:hypothetical protein D3C81_956300 [compost metagenome]